MNNWISVEDRLPEIDETVLLMHYYNSNIIWIASGERTVIKNEWYCNWDDGEFISSHYHIVTHWQPLLELPRE